MWNIPSTERLEKIPRLYETEKIQLRDKSVFLHFFIGGSDWYICEYDGENIFWGFCILNSDYQNAEWGYVSFSELKAIRIDGCFEVDCVREEYWQIQKASEIDKISMIHGWETRLHHDVITH
jgi:hypothetical protein